MKRLMVVSPSTEKYAEEFKYDEILIVRNPPTKETLRRINSYEEVIAIGGGSVIDTAKILCKDDILAIPTTYSGASGTSHAVVWYNKQKHSIKCKLPRTQIREDFINLPTHIEAASKIDCLSHLIESLVSPNGTELTEQLALEAIHAIKRGDWLYASILAGNCIEKTGTNLIHAMSYPLTSEYGCSHGVSLAHIHELATKYKKLQELL